MNYQTYGKTGIGKRLYNQVKYRFEKNQHTEALLKSRGLESYIPKLNKKRFGIAITLSLVFLITPFITLLAIPTMLWGIK